MADEVLYEKRDRIAYVTLNRPHAMNAIDPEMHAALWSTWEEVEEPPPQPASTSVPHASRQTRPGAKRRARIGAMFSER